MQAPDAQIQSQKLIKGFELIKQKKFDEAQILFTEGISESEAGQDKVLLALFYSAMGIVYKLKKEFRTAWKYYEKAEKLLPDDPSLKIISSRLLVDYFGQYDIVIKKMNKVLEKTKEFTPFQYQAHTVMGLAWLRKGNKNKAAESLRKSMDCLQSGMDTVANVDFELVESMARKKIAPQLCLEFLGRAKDLAKAGSEDIMAKFIQKLIDQFPLDPGK
ncbi:MAG: hypothetical protein ACD_73C00755G0002 [uncultured bacterium]|nr:MAG: hypothetical protein ACD_73C00755G0002 [uncultured bacterium]